MITTDDIDELGPDGIAEAIKKRVGDKPVYLRWGSCSPDARVEVSDSWTIRSLDIDVIGLS